MTAISVVTDPRALSVSMRHVLPSGSTLVTEVLVNSTLRILVRGGVQSPAETAQKNTLQEVRVGSTHDQKYLLGKC